MGPIIVVLDVDGVEVSYSFQDVESVTSDGRCLWINSLIPAKLEKFAMRQVRELLGTDVA